MDMNFTHKPNYFFFAERLIGFLSQKIQQSVDQTHFDIALDDLQSTFHQDFAAMTTNLEGILNIADQYKLNNQALISNYTVDAHSNRIDIIINPEVAQALKNGATLIAPDPTLYG